VTKAHVSHNALTGGKGKKMAVNQKKCFICLLFFCFEVFPIVFLFKINSQTCDAKQNIMFVIKELKCTFKGKGIYVMDKPPALETLSFDRLTAKSWIYISDVFNIQEIKIEAGPMSLCSQVLVNKETIKVFIGGQQCVS